MHYAQRWPWCVGGVVAILVLMAREVPGNAPMWAFDDSELARYQRDLETMQDQLVAQVETLRGVGAMADFSQSLARLGDGAAGSRLEQRLRSFCDMANNLATDVWGESEEQVTASPALDLAGVRRCVFDVARRIQDIQIVLHHDWLHKPAPLD